MLCRNPAYDYRTFIKKYIKRYLDPTPYLWSNSATFFNTFTYFSFSMFAEWTSTFWCGKWAVMYALKQCQSYATSMPALSAAVSDIRRCSSRIPLLLGSYMLSQQMDFLVKWKMMPQSSNKIYLKVHWLIRLYVRHRYTGRNPVT